MLFVWQTERHIEHFARQADGAWVLREYREKEHAPIATLGGALRLEEIYLKVFDAEA